MAALSVIRLLPDPPARVTGGEVLLAATTSGFAEQSMRSLRGEAISIVFPGTADSLDPVFTIGTRSWRHHSAPQGASARAREMAVEIPMSPNSSAAAAPTRLSHQLSGHATAVMIAMLLCSTHGSDRGRAHDGAGRHHPGADP